MGILFMGTFFHAFFIAYMFMAFSLFFAHVLRAYVPKTYQNNGIPLSAMSKVVVVRLAKAVETL